jgi:thiol-disulfide isomerase/thioredoxin
VDYLISAIVLLTLLGVGNLALTLALARRLRTGTATQSGLRLLSPGERVGTFAVTTTDGVQISDERLFAGTGLVAFLAPSCSPCQEQLPRVLNRAAEIADPCRVLAVVVDDHENPADVASEVAALRGSAQVVVARTGDRLMSAFGVDAYPALFLIDSDARVKAAGHDIGQLPALAEVS